MEKFRTGKGATTKIYASINNPKGLMTLTVNPSGGSPKGLAWFTPTGGELGLVCMGYYAGYVRNEVRNAEKCFELLLAEAAKARPDIINEPNALPKPVHLPYPSGMRHDTIAAIQRKIGRTTYRVEISQCTNGEPGWNAYRAISNPYNDGGPMHFQKIPAFTRTDIDRFPKSVAKMAQEFFTLYTAQK